MINAIKEAAARLATLNPAEFFQAEGFILSKLYGAIAEGSGDDKYALKNARARNRQFEEDGLAGVPELAARLHLAADASHDFVKNGRTKLSKLQYFVDHVLFSLSKELRRQAFANDVFVAALKTLLSQAPPGEDLETALNSLTSVEQCCAALIRRANRAKRVFESFFTQALGRNVTIRVALINGGNVPVVSLVDLVAKVWRSDLDQPDDYIRKILMPQLQNASGQDSCSSRDPDHSPLIIEIPDDNGYMTHFVDGSTARLARDFVLSQHIPPGLTHLVTRSVTLFEFFQAGDQRLHKLLDNQRDDTDVLVHEFVFGPEGAAQEREVAAAHGHIDLEMMPSKALQQSTPNGQVEPVTRTVVPVRRTIGKLRFGRVVKRQLKPLQEEVLQLRLLFQEHSSRVTVDKDLVISRVNLLENALVERATEVLSENRRSFLSELSLRLNQKLLDVRNGVIEAVMNPAGVLVRALHRATKPPAKRTTRNSLRFPENQHATSDDLAARMSLQLALYKELETPYRTPVGVILPGIKLTYGAWKKLRNVFGKRALVLRQEDNAAGRCDRPLLWAFTGSSESSGQRYVYLSKDAERYIKLILKQPAPIRGTVMMDYVRTVIASTPPESWPTDDAEVEPDWAQFHED